MSTSGDQEPIARLTGISIDVHDLEIERAFWQAALGTAISDESDKWVLFDPQPGCAGLSLQKVPEWKVKKNRAHPDLKLAGYENGVRRLEELGARRVREVIGANNLRWHIMLDPDGNEFCAIE